MKALGAMEIDIAAIDLILTQKRWSVYSKGECTEQRKLVEICEPYLGQKGVSARKIFSFKHANGKFAKEGFGEKCAEKICRAFGISMAGLDEEIGRRQKFLESLGARKSGGFFDAIHGFGKNAP